MTDTLPPPQSSFLDTQWRGHGHLDLLGVSFTSLKEQVDSEVGSAGVCWEERGSSGVTGCLNHPDPNLCCAQRQQRLLEEAQRLSDTLHR